MSVLDEVNKLKEARRAEIAAAEEAKQRAEEERKAAIVRQINAALTRVLGERGVLWLEPHARKAATVWDRDSRAQVVFDLPGHDPIGIRLRRIAGHDTDWRACSQSQEGVSLWCVIDVRHDKEIGFEVLSDALIYAEIPGWTPPPEPAAGRQLTPEAEYQARAAWEAMVQPVEPMPAGVALDMVQNETGDRDDAVTALHLAAADWLDALRPEQARPDQPGWVYSDSFNLTIAVRGYLVAEEYNLADNCRLEIHNTNRETQDEYHREYDVETNTSSVSVDEVNAANAWIYWSDQASRAIGLCRAVAAAAHPEPASST